MDFKSLSQYDDVLTDYFVDKLHLWFNTTRMNASMDCTFDERDEAIRIIQKDILVKGSTSVAAKNAAASFLKLPYFKNLTKNYSQTELKNFKHHLSLYLYMFSPRAGYEIASTVRYTGEMEGCVLAIRDWQAGEKVSCCVGTVAILSEEDDQALRDEGRDFSVMISTRYNTARLFLGPAKFMNHDCEANCRFVAEGSRVTFYTTKPIKCGEEMTVFYGDHYFGDGNCECRCASCQSNQRGHYAPPLSQASTTGDSSHSLTPTTPNSDESPRRRSSRKRKAVDYADFYVMKNNDNYFGEPTPKTKKQKKQQNVVVDDESSSKQSRSSEPKDKSPLLAQVKNEGIIDITNTIPQHNSNQNVPPTSPLRSKTRSNTHAEMDLSFICHGTENWLYMPVVEDPQNFTTCKRKRQQLDEELSTYKKICKGLDPDIKEHVLVPDPPLFSFAFKSNPNISSTESTINLSYVVPPNLPKPSMVDDQFDQWLDEQSDLSSVGSVSEEPTCCDQVHEFKVVYTPNNRPMCSRCFRHQKIFCSPWPLRLVKGKE